MENVTSTAVLYTQKTGGEKTEGKRQGKTLEVYYQLVFPTGTSHCKLEFRSEIHEQSYVKTFVHLDPGLQD